MKTGNTANTVTTRTIQGQFLPLFIISIFSLHYSFSTLLPCIKFLYNIFTARYISHYEHDLHIVSVDSPSLSNVKHVIS